MGIPVLIAEGGNELRIPCRLFDCSFEEAKGRMKEILGPPTREAGGDLMWSVGGEQEDDLVIRTPEFVAASAAASKFARDTATDDDRPADEGSSWHDRYDQEWERQGGDSLDDGCKLVPKEAIFTGYYGGCGDPGGFTLTQVEPNVPLVKWDLD